MRVKSILFILLAAALSGGCLHEELHPVDVYYTADVQGFYWSRMEPRFENKEAGGYAVLKNFLQTRPAPYLLFDGGNWFGSAPEGNLTKGAYVAELTKTIPYTAGSVSDKDLVYGWPSLRNTVRELPYPFIVSNLKLEGKIPWPMHDYQIRTVDGIKIGIFGLIDPQAINKNKGRLLGLTAQDPVQVAKDMTSLLREKGVDFIIVLSALGEEQKDGVSDASLAGEVEHLGLILSANKDRENAETDKINKTLIVYPGSKLDSLARVRLTFDKNNQLTDIAFTDVLLTRDDYGEDSEIAAATAALRRETQRKMNARVTTAETAVRGAWGRESALGNLLTDCLHKWSRLDGAVLNSDSIRQSLPAGRVTEYDVYKMYPYSDAVTFVTLKGRALQRALEASLAVKDNFPQISGMSVEYTSKPGEKPRIKRIVFDGGRVLRPQETYRIAMTDHVMAGGFGHDEFINALEFKNTFVEARQIMRTCLLKYKQLEAPQTGRWKKVQ